MNQKIVFPNNPLFFLQFIIFPGMLAFIASKVGVTVQNTLEVVGVTKVIIVIFSYFVFIVLIVLNSLVTISDEEIIGPSGGLRLFPLKHSLIGAEYAFENRRMGRMTHECLIIRNINQPGEICLSCLYFNNDFFDEIINRIRVANEQNLQSA